MSYPTDTSGATGMDNPSGAALGLCPLLVMATSGVDALGFAIAAFAALVTAGLVIASMQRWITENTRWPAMMLAIGVGTSTIALLLQAYAFDVHQRIAFLVPIAITNWFVLAQFDRAPHGAAVAIGGVTVALSAAAALVIVGIVCEAVGHGTLLAGIGALPEIRFADSGFALAAMSPGGFIIAGLLLAIRNATWQRT